MSDYCAFSRNHRCIKWMDYEITRHELEEADNLCHRDWIEIQRLRDYIIALKSLLEENGITPSEEDDFRWCDPDTE